MVTLLRQPSLLVFYFISIIAVIMPAGHARYHHHHHHHRHSHQASQISAPPEASPPAAPPPSGDDWRVYDVRMFGAIGDGVTDDTDALKSAWENACQIDSGVLLVPYGYTFMIQSTIFTGPCQNSFVFQVDGTIMPPEGPEVWPKDYSRRQWLVFYRVNEMALRGRGLIDGRGEPWWNLPCKPHKARNGSIVREPCDSPVVSDAKTNL